MHLTLKTPPVFEPITLLDLKAHTIVSHDEDDDYLFSLIESAREQVETDTGRALVEQTWVLQGDCFPDEIIVPKPPLVSVTHIKYFDTDGAPQTLVENTDFQVITTNYNARIKPMPGTSWPSVQANDYNAVELEFVCGYLTDDQSGGFAGYLPHRARSAMLIWAAHLYENREHMLIGVNSSELPSYRSMISGLEIISL